MNDEVRCAYCQIVFANLAKLDEHECSASELPESTTAQEKARIEGLNHAYQLPSRRFQ